MKFAAAKLPYLAHLKANPSEKTFKSFQAAINRFERRAHETGTLDPDLEHMFSVLNLEAFKNYLSSLGVKGQTVQAQFAALKSCWRYTKLKGWIDPLADPFAQVPMPKRVAPVREHTDEREVGLLFDATLRHHSEREIALNHFLLSTLVLTGVRCEELTNIEVSHIDFDRGTLEVRDGKGGRHRTLYPPDIWFPSARKWMPYLSSMNCTHPYVFPSSRTRRMSEDKVRERIEQLKAVAGLKGRQAIKPHSLRHFFAKYMELQGADLETIQSALGHESMETTLIYLRRGDRNTQKMRRFASLPCAELPTSLTAPELACCIEATPDAPSTAKETPASMPVAAQTVVPVVPESNAAIIDDTSLSPESVEDTHSLGELLPPEKLPVASPTPASSPQTEAMLQPRRAVDHPDVSGVVDRRRADARPQQRHWASVRNSLRRGTRIT